MSSASTQSILHYKLSQTVFRHNVTDKLDCVTKTSRLDKAKEKLCKTITDLKMLEIKEILFFL